MFIYTLIDQKCPDDGDYYGPFNSIVSCLRHALEGIEDEYPEQLKECGFPPFDYARLRHTVTAYNYHAKQGYDLPIIAWKGLVDP
jgi:hypothetical protein